MASFIQILKDIFLPNKTVKISTKVSNNMLLQELKNCFKMSLEEQSMEGQMLYDSNFLILLHPENYTEREQTFPFVVKGAINNFYKIIKDHRKKMQDTDLFIPPTDVWYIQFSPRDNFGEIEIKKGEILMISTFATNKFNFNSSTTNIRVTIKGRLSNVYESLNINTEAFKGVEILAHGLFSQKFDEKLNEIAELPKSRGSGLAELKYVIGIQEITYTMDENEIIITRNKTNTINTPHILAIDSDNISDQHARIKYDAHINKFFIAAFAKTTINEVEITLSKGGDVVWKPLDNNSSILLGWFGLKFKSLT